MAVRDSFSFSHPVSLSSVSMYVVLRFPLFDLPRVGFHRTNFEAPSSLVIGKIGKNICHLNKYFQICSSVKLYSFLSSELLNLFISRHLGLLKRRSSTLGQSTKEKQRQIVKRKSKLYLSEINIYNLLMSSKSLLKISI